MSITRRKVGAVAVAALLAGSLATAAGHAQQETERLSGTLPNGATWIADVPQEWNGVLLLYGHGYRPPGNADNPPQNAPDGETGAALLERGYALAGSSYATRGWTMATAAADQLGTLDAVTARLETPPRRAIAVGTSMGGLVTAQLAERGAGRLDGALATCGLVAGGIGLADSQLDGSHAVAELLMPGEDVPLVGFTDPAQVQDVVARMSGALDAAQDTPEGRARTALAAALFHLPTWYADEPRPGPRDYEAQLAAQYRNLADTLPFILLARFDVEQRAGGNPSTNAGVDYGELLSRSATRHQVRSLYRAAGLDLEADLARLTATADVGADPAARAWQRRTSGLTGDLAMPVLTMHTIGDGLVPVQFEDAYADTVRARHHRSLLRQSYVERTGHCTFTTAELVAAIEAVDTRVRTGRWGAVATPEALDAAAEATGLGAADYIRYRPGEFVADEVPRRHR